LTVVFYVSSHGFGHASRDIEVIKAIIRRRPDSRVVVRTNVPRWFFDRALSIPVQVDPCEVDTGMTQVDSLRLDETDTARSAAAFYGNFLERAAAEAGVLRDIGATVVVADVPPLGIAAAELAGIPSVVLANFTWDWIYAAYPDFERLAPGVVRTIGGAYSAAARALRLPFHGGFESMSAVIRDIPLVARRSRRDRVAVRQSLGLFQTSTVVLASFGRYGVDLPYEAIARNNAFTLVVTDREARGPALSSNAGNRLVRLSQDALAAGGMKYEDLVAAADVVVSKPGYGIVSECIANGTALLYTSRGRFAEHEVLVEGMKRFLRCRYITPQDLTAGGWSADVTALLNERVPVPPACNGADVAADEIFDVVDRRSSSHVDPMTRDPERKTDGEGISLVDAARSRPPTRGL
jgi:L-arabinokinase